MKKKRLSELCDILTRHGFPARLEGSDCEIAAVNTLEDASAGEISFLSNPKYSNALKETRASAVILKDGLPLPDGLSAIRCEDPYAAVTVSIVAIHGYRAHPQWGLSEAARIDPSASIGENANIAHGVTIAADVVIGDHCTIYPGVYIGDRTRIGSYCTLFPNVVVYDDCIFGDRVTIHACSVVGEDGVGYAPQGGKWLKIPQVGRAIIGDDVEIGANCSIDRATLGSTEIGSGTKFGNANLIAHGAKIGNDCMLVGQAGIAGSAKIGDRVTLGGKTGVSGHLTVGDDSSAGGGAVIYRSVPPGSRLMGRPAIPIEAARRDMIVAGRLPECLQRIKDLERELADLRSIIAEASS